MTETRRAAPPRPAPRPIARVLGDCTGLPLLGGAEVGTVEEIDVIEVEIDVEVTDAFVDTEEDDEVGYTRTEVVLRKKTPCPLSQHDELELSQHQLPSPH